MAIWDTENTVAVAKDFVREAILNDFRKLTEDNVVSIL